MSKLSLETYLPNLKAVALNVLELLVFNGQKFRGSHDPGHAPFWRNFKRTRLACSRNLDRDWLLLDVSNIWGVVEVVKWNNLNVLHHTSIIFHPLTKQQHQSVSWVCVNVFISYTPVQHILDSWMTSRSGGMKSCCNWRRLYKTKPLGEAV